MDRNVFPPGGWKFYQPETGWSVPSPMSTSFNEAAALIASHRRANPALAATAAREIVEKDLEDYTRSRVESMAPPVSSFAPSPSGGGKGCASCGRR